MWQALADPEGQYFWPRPANDVLDEVGRWAPAVHLVAYSLAWPRIDLGFQRWIRLGRPALDERLGLLNDMLGERVAELAEWFATSVYASVVMNSIGSSTATTVDMSGWQEREFPHEPLSPVGGGGDEFHFSRHVLCGVEADEDADGGLLFHDSQSGQACLVIDGYQGWYRALTRKTAGLAPRPGGASWRVEVVCRPVGHLGVFRPSRISGRWFAGRHRVHELGIP
jgi:hypothetical protein